ncbi:hypothetical protein [Methylobacterium radiotolerans]|uniref:hypothetical protein n=1 Tax=Methylobacterium radiotolerans TaxID=31998 RepID=UPI00031B4DB7|nr:hypothetical protein [Methylobacterium radiotolerans]GEN01524.1 hypothetical protein MRA01_60630 [Methylobacterium radiotolerans]
MIGITAVIDQAGHSISGLIVASRGIELARRFNFNYAGQLAKRPIRANFNSIAPFRIRFN